MVVDAALGPIRRSAERNAEVTAIAFVAQAASRREDRAVLWRHAGTLARGAGEYLRDEEDRRMVEETHRAASRVLRKPGRAAG